MGPELLAYPFLFIAIFFESFVLVTLLSRPARLARARRAVLSDDAVPTVAVIVPCYNEEKTVEATIESLLALDYPSDRLAVIIVNDGSTDGTQEVIERYTTHPQVKIILKENGGKHTALNTGIAATTAELIGCLDADSFVEPNALREIVRSFEDPKVAATTAAMSVHKPQNALQHMQNAEYIFGITLRHVLSTVNGIYVTPGPFSFYRRLPVLALGGFRYGHQTEDLEMALRLQKAGHWIDNAPRARVYTKAPRTLLSLLQQRTRWTTGFMRNTLIEYRDLIGSRKHNALGILVLPLSLLAIMTGILMFGLAIYTTVDAIITFYQLRSGIPLSYLMQGFSSFDWFYLPTTTYIFLGAVLLISTFILIVIGKRLSQTPSRLAYSLLTYACMYGFIVPFWLIRATTDVALGKKRNWR